MSVGADLGTVPCVYIMLGVGRAPVCAMCYADQDMHILICIVYFAPSSIAHDGACAPGGKPSDERLAVGGVQRAV